MKNKLSIIAILCFGIGCVLLDVSDFVGIAIFFLVIGLMLGILALFHYVVEFIERGE